MHLLSTALQLFVILMMVAFIVGCISALTGSYDHWGNRYVLKARRSRLIRTRAAKLKVDKTAENITPYRATKINKNARFSIVKKPEYAYN